MGFPSCCGERHESIEVFVSLLEFAREKEVCVRCSTTYCHLKGQSSISQSSTNKRKEKTIDNNIFDFICSHIFAFPGGFSTKQSTKINIR